MTPAKPLLMAICLLAVAAAVSTAYAGESGTSRGGPATDSAGLMDTLNAAGLRVEQTGEVDQPFLSVTGGMISMLGEDIQLFQYATAAVMEAQAARISPDGNTVGTTKLQWIGSPHFYKQGRLLVLYVGNNEKVLHTLEQALGSPFAGQ
jgi:hypothetical protein